MERIRNLDRYQKGILILLIAMVLVFTVLYGIITSREGFRYNDAFLRLSSENGNTVYSGRMHGNPVTFTVTPDKAVTFQYGDEVYGPYTASLDSSATPPGNEGMTGIELRRGDEVIFRGGAYKQSHGWFCMPEDGDLSSMIVVGTTTSAEPSFSVILELMAGPELTHPGTWLGWIIGTFLCLATGLTILFADEIFRFKMSYRVYNVDEIEPADWEIISRYIAWTLTPIAAVVLFILGLR